MEEIKETKTKKIIKFLLDHIMVISAIIFLCVLLFSSCSTAKAADSYPDNPFDGGNVQTPSVTFEGDFWEAYDALIGNRMTSEFQNNINSILESGYTKFIFFHDEDTLYSFLLLPEETIGLYYYWGNSRYFKPFYSDYSWHVNNRVNYLAYCVKVNTASNILYCQIGGLYASSMNPTVNSALNKTVYSFNYDGGDQIYYYKGGNGSTGAAWYGGYIAPPFVADWNYRNTFNTSAQWGGFASNFTLMCSTNGSISDYSPIKTNNINGILYTEDNRLKIYTVNDISGNKSVVFDLDDFNFSNYSGNDAATQNTLYNNQISVTVDFDGTEQVFILDNTNSDILPAYLIETPYSFFNLGEYTNVKIIKVEFSKLIHYMPSEMREDEIENYYISCEYYLKRPESAPDASDIPYNSDVDNTKITQLQIDEKNEIINYDNGYYSPSGGGGDPLIVPDGYTIKLITVTGSDTLASILNDIYNGRYILNGLSGIYQFTNDVVDYITGINTTDQFMEFMEDSIKNNNYSLLYDFVVYYWAPDASLAEPDVMYYYLTNSGKLRTINKTLADIWKESNQVSVNTGSLYDYLKERLDDFENQTLDLLYGNNKLVESSNEWLQTINNTLSNLSFSDPFDDSDILDKLDYVISILDDIAGFFSGDSNEGYSKFTKWIEEIEDDGEITPHEWANDIFNFVTGLYHSLSDGTSYYTNDITDYINYVNRDGNSDPGNYFFAMYEGTYDPHNYYGWTGGNNE